MAPLNNESQELLSQIDNIMIEIDDDNDQLMKDANVLHRILSELELSKYIIEKYQDENQEIKDRLSRFQ